MTVPPKMHLVANPIFILYPIHILKPWSSQGMIYFVPSLTVFFCDRNQRGLGVDIGREMNPFRIPECVVLLYPSDSRRPCELPLCQYFNCRHHSRRRRGECLTRWNANVVMTGCCVGRGCRVYAPLHWAGFDVR